MSPNVPHEEHFIICKKACQSKCVKPSIIKFANLNDNKKSITHAHLWGSQGVSTISTWLSSLCYVISLSFQWQSALPCQKSLPRLVSWIPHQHLSSATLNSDCRWHYIPNSFFHGSVLSTRTQRVATRSQVEAAACKLSLPKSDPAMATICKITSLQTILSPK